MVSKRKHFHRFSSQFCLQFFIHNEIFSQRTHPYFMIVGLMDQYSFPSSINIGLTYPINTPNSSASLPSWHTLSPFSSCLPGAYEFSSNESNEFLSNGDVSPAADVQTKSPLPLHLAPIQNGL